MNTPQITAPKITKRPLILAITAAIIVAAVVGAWFIWRPQLSFGIDPQNAPAFVTANPVDISQYGGVSKFRSAVGHDFSGGGESCRSMKHYYLPKVNEGRTDDPASIPKTIDPATNLPAFSPVTGEVTAIVAEQHPLGKQIYLRPTGQESYTVRLFHVYPLDTVTVGAKVTAGERIGSLLPWQQTDISVSVMTLTGSQFISVFDVMDDTTLATYKDRGAEGTTDFIISRETRDANPLTCDGEAFADKDTFTGDHWFFFNDYTPAYDAPRN
jgi:hypothetical protein